MFISQPAMSRTLAKLRDIFVDEEPIVIEIPANMLGMVDDAMHEWEFDLGFTGADKGKGGKYIIAPEGYKCELSEGYNVAYTKSKTNFLIIRGFIDPVKGVQPTVDYMKAGISAYPLSQAGNPPAEVFTDITDKPWNVIHANNFDFS